MLGMPAPTEFDLRFRLLGIPVRVHPMFWFVTALLGGVGVRGTTIQGVLLWIGCAFVSILVHEFGHGLMARAFGYRASIVLFGMGGLCASEGERQSPGQRLAVLVCGPGAGFLLFGLVLAGDFGLASRRVQLSDTAQEIISILLVINLCWGILNLFPIWPLDGGQITGVLLTLLNRRQGMRWTHAISLVLAGLLAALALMYHSTFNALFFGYFALSNFQMLQALQHGVGDDDWWRR
jgi:stage IV sporulation protein FB